MRVFVLKDLLRKIICVLCFLLPTLLAFPLPEPLRVGIINYPPFDIIEDGTYSGVAVEIWQSIAELNHWNYNYIVLPNNVEAALKKVQSGDLDILVSSIDVTNNRMREVDFTRIFFIEKIAVTMPAAHNYWAVFHQFLGTALLYIAGISIVCFFVYIHLLWFFERGKNEKISINYRIGIEEILWTHVLNRKLAVPKTLIGRIMTLTWLILSMTVFASYSASMTSALTLVLTSEKNSMSFDTLKGMRLAGIAGALPSMIVEQKGIPLRLTHTIGEAFDLLKNNTVDGIVSSDVISTYYLQKHPTKEKYIVASLDNQNNESAFALPLNSPLIHKINLALTDLQDKQKTIAICQKYLRATEAGRCNL